MSQSPENGPQFHVGDSAPAMIAGLTAALQSAIEFAVFPERLKVDAPPSARVEALSKQLLRETKSIPTHFLPETDEARGLSDAIAVVESIINQFRRET